MFKESELGVGNFGKVGVGCFGTITVGFGYFTTDSTTLRKIMVFVCTSQTVAFCVQNPVSETLQKGHKTKRHTQ